MKNALGEFEMLVMLAVLRLSDDAYGTSIRRHIEEYSGRKASRGAIYATLERLEAKGFLSSYFGPATPQRGGRAKRFFAVEPQGLAVLRATRNALRRMWSGLEPMLEKP